MNRPALSPIAVLLASSVVIAACADGTGQGIVDTIRGLDPTADTYEQVEGRYVETIAEGSWHDRSGVAPAAAFAELPPGLQLARRNYYALIPNERLESYLSGIAGRIVQASPRRDTPYRILLAADPYGGRTQAMPDGTIAVSIEMLRPLGSEDAVAAMLAHELSHVMLRHHDNAWITDFHERLEGLAELGLELYAEAGAVMQRFGDSSAALQVSQATGEVGLAAFAVRETLYTGLMPSWSRKHEDQADLLGTDLLVEAGYNPLGMSDFLVALVAATGRSLEVAKAASASANASRSKLEAATSRLDLQGMIAALVETGVAELEDLRSYLRRNHADAKKRLAAIDTYIEREYVEASDQPYTEAPWQAVRQSREIAGLFDGYAATWRAEALALQGDLPQAEAAARRAVSGQTRNHAAPWRAFAQVRKHQGDLANYDDNLRIAMTREGAGLPLHVERVESLIARQEWVHATEIAKHAWREFREPSEILPHLIYLDMVQGNEAEAQTLYIECTVNHRPVAQVCNRARNRQLQTAGRID